MKLKALLLALFVAGFAVSVALAGSPARTNPSTTGTDTSATTATSTTNGKGKGKAKGLAKAPACKPARKLVLKGEYVSGGPAGFALKVTGGNKPAKAWRGKQATVLVDTKTRVHGAKRELAALAAGDRLTVQGFACKADAAAGTALARKVGVKGAKGAEDGSTTTTTSTTGTTTTAGTTTGS